ncbi:MAG: transglutaminase-like domain-containing protein [Polyangiaceae bacterium]
MNERFLRYAPLVVAIALYFAITHEAFIALGFASVVLVLVLFGPLLVADKVTMRLGSLVLAVVTFAVVNAYVDPPNALRRLKSEWVAVATSAIALALFRSLVRNVEWGLRATFAVLVWAIVALGETLVGVLYTVGSLTFLATTLLALRVDDPHRPASSELSRKNRVGTWVVVVVAGVLATGFVLPLRPMREWLHKRFEGAYGDYLAESNFAANMRLDAVDSMLLSNAPVLRLRGARVDYLRAAIFVDYEDGRWFRLHLPRAANVEADKAPQRGDDAVNVDFVVEENEILPVPLEARAFATATGKINVDAVGIARKPSLLPARRYGFRVADGPRDVTPPTAADVAISRRLEPTLAAAVRAWVPSDVSRHEALQVLERKLMGAYEYELASKHTRGVDPIVDFLTTNKKGNCEFFATAFALVARRAGVPTRLVAGYRVGEHNPIGDHWVVRKKNAHAWVEAWIDDPESTVLAPKGHWERFDPTPMTELMQNQTHDLEGASAVTDFVGATWRTIEGWLAERTLKELLVTVLAGTFFFALVRWWTQRKPGATARPEDTTAALPTATFAELERVLAERGVLRARWESLETFARRAPDDEVRGAILRYAALRYGRQGDPGAVESELMETTSRLRGTPRAATV